MAVLILSTFLGACDPPPPPVTPTSTPAPFPKSINLISDMSIAGSAVTTTQGNCSQILEGMSNGVILGVDPQTCEIDETYGTQAVFHFFVPPEYVNNVFTLKISWPEDGVRGLRASTSNKVVQIGLKGITIWEKSAFAPGDNGFFYAARTEPILLTIVPRQSGDYSIEINLSAGMAWDISSIQLSTSPYPQNMLGIAYSPYQDCQSADSSDNQPIQQDLWFDLYKLAQSATALRTYSSIGVNAEIVPIAIQLGIPVYAGAWIDGNVIADEDEMRGIIQTANKSPIKAAIIGNEYYLRHYTPEALGYLLQRLREFKTSHPEIPVATAEIDSFAFDWDVNGIPSIKPEYRPIIDEVDIFLVHIYPFWNYLPVEGGAKYTVDRYLAIKTLLDKTYQGNKHLILGEAGWPALGAPGLAGNSGQSGNTEKASPALHPEEQRQYMIELLDLAQKNRVDMFFFSAFDELWKTEGVDGAGSSWGYNYADRTAKFNFSGLLLPPESLPSATQGDIFNPYQESDFTWRDGEYPIYTEWPREPKGRPIDIPEPGHYFPAYTGDLTGIEMFQCERKSHSGETAIKIQYSPGGEKGWSGIYWLHPKNNIGLTDLKAAQQDWSGSIQGINLPTSQKLIFWARGEKGNEIVEFVVGGVCGPYDGTVLPSCPDSIQPRISTGPIVLSSTWQKYVIDLRGVDRTNIVGAFGLAVSQIHNPEGATFYLDDIAFAPDPPLASETVYPLPRIGPFSIYTDYTALGNHYIPSNFMGDGETPCYLTLNQSWNVDPSRGDTAIEVQYSRGPLGWAGVFWTDPEDNWGQIPGGYDLTGVTKLTYWAKSDHPGLHLQILIGGVSCLSKKFPYHDSVCDGVPISRVTLTTEWKQYTINLKSLKRDWTRLLGGFGFVVNQPGTFYLDDIQYELNK